MSARFKMAATKAEEKMVGAQEGVENKEPKAAKKAKAPVVKNSPAKQNSDHPKFLDIIMEAIEALQERNGSSRKAIEKYVSEQYHIDTKEHHAHFKAAYKRGVENGSLKPHKASFKINKASTPKSKAKSSKGAAKSHRGASQG